MWFGVSMGSKGDCLDRYLIRMNESLESVKIIQQLFLSFSTDCIPCIVSSAVMESMIEGFRFITNLMLGETYLRQEAPKGELGLYIVSDNRNKVYRLKIRSPDYYIFQSLNIISHNHLLADVIAILGTSDFVLGSVDKSTRYDYTNAITIGTIISGVLVTTAT